jgi:hypothetical protein
VAIREQSASVVWSTFDQHLVLAVNGEPLLESALPDAGPALNPDARRSPEARIGASNLRVSLSHVKLYRDIYYTPPDNPVAEYQLGRGEYFVLGDNSPVSIDSRHWDRPGVPLEALIGKPLLVHLPSRPGTLTWGGQSRRIRVPDISRIRYIR